MKQPIRHRFALWALAFGVAGLFNPAASFAQTVFVDTPLSFGRFVVRDFDDPIEITIENDGNYTINSNTYIIVEPTLGEYTVQDAPVSSVYTITVPPSVTLGGPGGNFILDEIEVKPDSLATDINGEDNFTLSGRLRSAGGGTHYGDGTYSDNFSIIFNF
jgi:hypothetical protein